MSDDKFNLSMRKFLKIVGITSQQKIEEAVRKLDNPDIKTLTISVQLKCNDLDLSHQIDGQIELPEQ